MSARSICLQCYKKGFFSLSSKNGLRVYNVRKYATEPKGLMSASEKEKLAYLRRSKEVFETNLYEPSIDLADTRGISVNHMTKENRSSALLRQCLSEQPDREGFFKAVDIYVDRNKRRHGHMEFIVTAMKFIEPYGLAKDLEVYNKLLDVFPRDKFVNRTLFDAIWPKQHPQMNLALDILTKMEWQGIMPSEETHDLLYSIFGRASFPLKKVYRMWFWFETLKDINPYYLPDEVYKDRLNIVRAGIDRILGNNDGTKIIEISSAEETEDESSEMVDYKHFIISSQSEYQKQCISMLTTDKTVFVEGPINIWLGKKREEYFILKTGRQDLMACDVLTVQPDEEREGVVLAVCFATRPYRENISKWLTYLQEENKQLKEMNIVYNISDGEVGYERPTLAPPVEEY